MKLGFSGNGDRSRSMIERSKSLGHFGGGRQVADFKNRPLIKSGLWLAFHGTITYFCAKSALINSAIAVSTLANGQFGGAVEPAFWGAASALFTYWGVKNTKMAWDNFKRTRNGPRF
jgi:hypothetical protein